MAAFLLDLLAAAFTGFIGCCHDPVGNHRYLYRKPSSLEFWDEVGLSTFIPAFPPLSQQGDKLRQPAELIGEASTSISGLILPKESAID